MAAIAQPQFDFAAAPQRVPGIHVAPSTLRDYVAEVDRIAALVEALDEGEDISDEARDLLQRELIAAMTGTREKVDRVSSVISQYEAAQDAAAKEIARLQARAKYFERQRERLESYVLWILTTSKLRTLEGITSSFTSRVNPPSVAIDDAAAIPAQYLRQPAPPAPTPDKAAIKAAISAGADVPGARITRTERLVRS